jgi:hypothetical protein
MVRRNNRSLRPYERLIDHWQWKLYKSVSSIRSKRISDRKSLKYNLWK